MAFDPSSLINILAGLPVARAYCVALSGGADSVALLRALAEVRPRLSSPLKAIHVNHGLQPRARQWADFCRDLCLELQIPCEIVTVKIDRNTKESLEAAARHARYRAIGESLGSGEAVLTAHHQDDQAETILLHLLKGAGADGLAAMPVWRPFADGFLFRPLLEFRREQLIDWLVKGDEISWVEDESNKNLDFERNFLRHEILPGLEGRWPGVVPCLARSASHQAAQSELNAEMAKRDLEFVSELADGTLQVEKLLTLTPARRNNLLHWWLRESGPKQMPSQRQLEVIYHDVLLAAGDRQPESRIGGAVLRRYDGKLYKTVLRKYAPLKYVTWKLDQPLELPQIGLYLEPQAILRMFAEYDAGTLLTIRFRQGGERFKPEGDRHHRSLKQLFQRWHVPPWKRDRIALIYHKEKFILMLGYAKSA